MEKLSSYSLFLEKEISTIEFPKTPSNLYDPLRYFLSIGGKRMRPILTLMACELFGQKKEAGLNAALAIEIFHNFSLIHDDIMDEAPLRRNLPTVHSKWNQNIAILAGDVLLVKAYEYLANCPTKHVPDLLRLFNKTAREVCEGQQMDMDFESRTDVSIPEYIEMIRLKTSVLLGCALEMGAIIAEADERDRKALYDFGVHIGIAFQIQDDILDLYADPEKFGKQVGGDVISNKKTLLNLKAWELASVEEKNKLQVLHTESDQKKKVQLTTEIYDSIDVKSFCENEMQEHYALAFSSLDKVSTSEDSKTGLRQLAEFLFKRDH